jgi:hypothetical protein
MGRKPHVKKEKFEDFIEGIPDELTNEGYWKVNKENFNKKGGGVIKSTVGYLPFENEDYDSLRDRILERFAEKYGPAVYYATPCDSFKKEIRDKGMVKFEFGEDEVDMPDDSANANLQETLKSMKKMQKDLLEMNNMNFQKQMMESLLGGNKAKEEKEEPVVESSTSDPFQMMMMMKMFDGDDKKGSSGPSSSEVASLMDTKIDSAMARMEALIAKSQPKEDSELKMLLMKLVEGQQDKGSSKTEMLLERLVNEKSSEKQENAFQSMMALQIKQQEERERVRQEEERKRESDQKEERRRLEDERKEERRRVEDQAKLDREKFEKQLREEQRRFDEQMQMRREEMKTEQEKSRQYSSEQQGFQLKLLDIFKNNKDSSLETTSKIVETLTGAGLSSMQTAQQAAETIMSIAKKAEPSEKKEEEGIGKILKDVGQIAAPLLAPYADADAKLKMLKAASAVTGGQAQAAPRPQQRKVRTQSTKPKEDAAAAQAQAQAQAQARAAAEAQQLSELSPEEQAQLQQYMAQQAAAQQASSTTEGTGMIAQYLSHYPIVKQALIGNLTDGLGPRMFLRIIDDLGEMGNVLEGLIANLPPQVLLDEVKRACTPEEALIVEKNADWFKQLRQIVIQNFQEEEADDEDDDEEEEELEAPPVAEPPKEAPKEEAPAAAPPPPPASTPQQ